MAFQRFIRIPCLHMKLIQCGSLRALSSTRPEKLPTFSEVQELRQKQAKQSLLVQVSSVNSSELLGPYLEQYGTISNVFHYTADKKEFLFVEMSSPAEVEAVLQDACHPYRDKVVPVTSPLLWLRSAGPPRPNSAAAAAAAASSAAAASPSRLVGLPPVVTATVPSLNTLREEIASCSTLDEQLARHCELTRLTELGARLRYFTCELLERAVAGLFPAARARPFGSSANGFGRHDCDVDLILELTPQTNVQPSQRLAFQTVEANKSDHQQTRRYLSFIGDMLAQLMPGCSQVRRIPARVPIVKYIQTFTGVDCDISMARGGLHMTELMYIWSQLDTRVQPLVRAIRHWAEKVRLTNRTSGAGRFISNFGLTLLVIYFLQTRPVPLLPSVNELTQMARPGDSAHVDGCLYTFLRDPSLVPATANTESLSDLLAEFFALYSDLDLSSQALSVVWAGRFGHPGDSPLHVQNPLDLELNVTKNVSREEVCRLGQEAARAGRLLAEGRWWELVLEDGVPQAKAKPFSVQQLFDTELEESTGGREVSSPRPAADTVKLANLLGGAEAAGRTDANGLPRGAAFSGLRLTVGGETPGAERAPLLATISAARAAAAAAERRAAQAAAAARERRVEAEAMALLDATADRKPAKRKKKRKGSQAGR